MPLHAQTNDTATTPGRKAHLFLDPALPVVKEAPIWWIREKEQMARRGLDDANSENVRRYATGAIGLMPIQLQPGVLSETNSGAIIEAAEWDIPTASGSSIMQARPRFRQQSELTGLTYDAGVQSSGDNFLVKIIKAGISWAQGQTADVASFGQPDSGGNAPMDRVMVGKTTDAQNQGYCFRFEVPGTQLHVPQALKYWYFGGTAGVGGLGSYCLGVDGAGIAKLFERNETYDWVGRFKFRYAQADRISGVAHQIIAKPYNFPGIAGGIEFIVSSGDTAAPQGGLVQQFYNAPSLPTIHLYTISRKSGEVTRPAVTGAGVPRVDIRRDLRPYVQVSRVAYPASGYFIDGNIFVPFSVGTGQAITIVWNAVVPAGCSLIGKIYNAADDAELALSSSTANSRAYTFPANGTHFYARFEYTSDGTDTPLLWNYQIQRRGLIAEPAGSETDATDYLLDVSVSGAENDPSHESVSLTITDPRNILTVLNTRGRVGYRLETEYDPNDASKRSVLSSGFLLRTQGRRRSGKRNEGFNGGGAERQFPHAKWREFAASGVGHWLRLSEKFMWQQFDFRNDINGSGQTWKVTDVVYFLLNYAGYPDDMIDVPDNPLRLWATDVSTLAITPMQGIGDFCIKLLREYLGWFLVWDANAGTRGKWRAIAPSTAPYTPLATFKTTPTHTGRLVHSAGAYGNANAGYYSESGSVTAFIQKQTLTTWVKPPEANAILVIGGGVELPNKQGSTILANWMINKDGLDYFSNYTPDPENPDWIGELVPLVYVDYGLNSQAAVDFLCRRLYDMTTHGIKMARFAAPLVLITNAADSDQTNPRPLRYYDPVTIDDDGISETWLIRNVNPQFRKSAHQFAIYEAEAPRV